MLRIRPRRLSRDPQRAPDDRPVATRSRSRRPTTIELELTGDAGHARRRLRRRRISRSAPPSRCATAGMKAWRAHQPGEAHSRRGRARRRQQRRRGGAARPQRAVGRRREPQQNLVEIAGEIGSDPPFFIVGGTALCARPRRARRAAARRRSRRRSCSPRRAQEQRGEKTARMFARSRRDDFSEGYVTIGLREAVESRSA